MPRRKIRVPRFVAIAALTPHHRSIHARCHSRAMKTSSLHDGHRPGRENAKAVVVDKRADFDLVPVEMPDHPRSMLRLVPGDT